MKLVINIFVIGILISYSPLFGQEKYVVWASYLQNRSIVSEVSNVSSKSAPEQSSGMADKNLDNVEFIGGKSQKSVNRELRSKLENGRIFLTLKLTRITQKDNVVDVDTDSPYASNQLSQLANDNYLQLIKQPVFMEVASTGELISIKDSKQPVLGQWNAGLPKLFQIGELSSIVLSMPQGDTKVWVDSLKDDNGIYVNKYSIIEDINNTIKIDLVGRFVNKSQLNNDIKQDSKFNVPQNGESIIATVLVKSMSYEGQIIADKSSTIIKDMNIKINKISNISMMGQNVGKQEQLSYTVTNKIK